MSAERPFQIHDIVRYSTTGVCEIEDITVMKFGKKETSYYVLQPELVTAFIIAQMGEN